jgi:hypothetical protein
VLYAADGSTKSPGPWVDDHPVGAAAGASADADK